MTSVYRWQGQMERGQEHQLLIKTKLAQFEAVEKTIKLVHPYELPEIVVVPIVGGHQPYLNWITESVAKHE
jgi:periplasmic divalent cation tolerance protein